MSVLLTSVLLLVVSLSHVSLAQQPTADEKAEKPKSKTSLQVDRDVILRVENRKGIAADIYRPSTDSLPPLVVMIHGGGWISGDKWNVVDHARELALEGFVVVAINYRLAPKHVYPAMLEDCETALLWLNDHSEEHRGDLQRVGLWGYSAGAQLASMLAMHPPEGAPAIKCCVAGGLPSDLTRISESNKILAGVFGGTRGELPELYEQASVIHQVREGAPPFFIFHGSEDWLVPVDNARRFDAKLKEAKVPCELFELPGQGHLVTFMNSECRKKAKDFLVEQLQPAKSTEAASQ